MAVPAFFHARQIYFMLGWDALGRAAGGGGCGVASRPEEFLGDAGRFWIRRSWGGLLGWSLRCGWRRMRWSDVRMVDDLHAALVAMPAVPAVEAFPREDAVSVSTIYPRERGDLGWGGCTCGIVVR